MKNSIKKTQFLTLLLFMVFSFSMNLSYAYQQDSLETENVSDSSKSTEELPEVSSTNEVINEDRPLLPKISEPTVRIVSLAFFAVMLALILLFFNHIRKQNQYMGFQSIKYIGLVLMFPGICILALVGGEGLISGSTLAALLGTIAGYVLSRERDDDSGSKVDATLKKENEELKAKIEELTEQMNS